MKQVHDPGLGTSYQKSVKRMLNQDGSFNIQRIGTVTGYRDIYKYLIDLSSWKFAGFLTFAFFFMNVCFALGYVLIGTDQLQGIPPEQNPFVGALYFSVQIFTTVGYGAIAPKGNGVSILASIEAFTGLIAFAMATSLIYGRFSRPSAKIAFSNNVLITPHKDGMALMFKMVNQRNSVLLNTKVNVLLSTGHRDHHQSSYMRNYYSLVLEADSVRYFPLTWTIVHPISEQSPLYGMTIQQIRESTTEVLILVEAFDETFSQMVVQKHSYADDQWLEGVRFKRNFSADDKGRIVLDIRELHAVEPVEEKAD